jgi:hypothetical protein
MFSATIMLDAATDREALLRISRCLFENANSRIDPTAQFYPNSVSLIKSIGPVIIYESKK